MPAERPLPRRVDIERALRQLGLSHRVARKAVAVMWPHVVGETQAEVDELRAQLQDLKAKIAP